MKKTEITKKLTIVIPAYNEEKTIGSVLSNIKANCSDLIKEIIVVDDGSTDETFRIAKEADTHVIRHKRNKGYGASLKSGIRAAQTEFILTMDSDGQHKAEEIKKFYKWANSNDMVVGHRTDLIHSPLWRMPGKWLLSIMVNYLTRQKIPDLNCGFRLIRRDVALKYLHLCPSGFSFSITITMVLLSQGYNVKYIPIKVEKRIGKSLVSLTTGLETIILILRIATLFDPLRIFIPASGLLGTIGVLWAIPIVIMGRGISVGALLAIVTSMLLFGIGLLCDQISQMRLNRFE